MATAIPTLPTRRRPVWIWLAAGLGLVWNLFGLMQFADSVTSTTQSLIDAGMTAHQAAIMKGYPIWMTIAFAVGTLGGVLGCFLLVPRPKQAVVVFWISLVAYVILYIGDYTQGVFAAMGASQVIILSVVVAIAIGLLVVAYVAAIRVKT